MQLHFVHKYGWLWHCDYHVCCAEYMNPGNPPTLQGIPIDVDRDCWEMMVAATKLFQCGHTAFIGGLGGLSLTNMTELINLIAKTCCCYSYEVIDDVTGFTEE